MPASPLAGKPAPADVLIDVDRLVAAYYDRRPDPANPRQLVSFGTSGHRGAPEDGAFNEAHILVITQAICEYRAKAGITGPLFLGTDTHAASAPALRTALEVLAANGVDTRVERAGDYTPTPVAVTGHPRLQRRAQGRARRRHHHHAVPQPPARRRLQVQPAPRRPRRQRRHRRHSGARQRSVARRHLHPPLALRAGSARPHHARPRLHLALRRRPGRRHRSGSHRAGQGADRRRSHGWGQRAVLVAHRRAVRPRPHGGEREGRPAIRLHAARSRRQDPHGLLQPLRHGQPARSQGPIRCGLRQRHRRRPPRDRHAQCRSHEPEPLPGGGHRLPVPASPRMAGQGGHRQDAGVEHAHRPGGGEPRPGAARGAGRVQVVREWVAGRQPRIRRRRERRSQLPAPRRTRLDHRQGRDPPGPAVRRDHGGDRQKIPAPATSRCGPDSERRTTRASTHRRRRQRRPRFRAYRPKR